MRSTITLYLAGSPMRVPPSFTNSAATPSFLPSSFTRTIKAGGKLYSRPQRRPIFFICALLPGSCGITLRDPVNSPRAPRKGAARSRRRGSRQPDGARPLSDLLFRDRRAVGGPRWCLPSGWCGRIRRRCGFRAHPPRRPPVPAVPEPTGTAGTAGRRGGRSEEHTSELQSRGQLVCRLLLLKKKRPIVTDHQCLEVRCA